MASAAAGTETSTPAPSRWRTLAPLAAAPLLLIALIAWAYSSPVGASPDDDFHLVSAWCSEPGPVDCEPGSSSETRVVPLALLTASCFAFESEESARCQGTSLTDEKEPTVESDRGNFSGTYPPLFYAVNGLFASSNIEASVLAMRTMNAIVFVALGTLIACALAPARRGALTMAWLVTSVPLTMFIIPSNNPSSWALAGVALSWMAWWGYYESEGRRRVVLAVAASLASVMAAGARADAAAYVALGVACVTFIQWNKIGPRRLVALVPPAIVVAVCAAVTLTSGQASAVSGLGEAGSDATGVALLAYNLLNLPRLWTGGFGSFGLGWLDTEMPPIVIWAAAAAFIGVAFVGLRALSRRSAVAAAVVAGAIAFIPLFVLQAGGDGVGANVQPRYIWPLMTLFVGLLVARADGTALNLGRLQIILIGTGLAIANAVALYVNMRRYLTGTDVQQPSLDDHAEWWWHSAPAPNLVWVGGSIAFALAVVLLLVDYRRAMAVRASSVGV